MKRWRHAALAALASLFLAPSTAGGQDTIPTVRHLLPLDLSRVQPFRRAYDIVVLSGDSLTYIGHREVALEETLLVDSSPGWLLTESRTGQVPACDSLVLGSDLRPVSWASTLGGSRAHLDFRGDSAFGSARSPAGSSAMSFISPPDLVLTGAMLDLLATALPLSNGWGDSISVLSADLNGFDVLPGELLVIGEEVGQADSLLARPLWLLALRAESRQVLLWIDKATGAVTKSQQTLSPHTGTLLEFRERSSAEGAAAP